MNPTMPAAAHSKPAGEQHGRRREEFLRVAASVFARRGYRGAGMREIAQQCGVRPAALYYYFPSKVMILAAICQYGVTRFVERLAAIQAADLPVETKHPDYVALLLVNHILGGYFGSRLMKNIREEKGLTYGISSSIHSHLHESIFSIGTDVNKDKLEIIMIEIQKEITKLRSEPISLEELELSKNHILGNLQLEISNAFSITEKIKNLRLNQLPSDYYTDLFKKIKETNSSYLQKIVNTYLDWETMYEVTVG